MQRADATELSGNLADPQGNLLPGVAIRLLRRADSTRCETRTDAQGRFSFNNLNGGEYRVTAESTGFAVITRTLAVQPEGLQTANPE